MYNYSSIIFTRAWTPPKHFFLADTASKALLSFLIISLLTASTIIKINIRNGKKQTDGGTGSQEWE